MRNKTFTLMALLVVLSLLAACGPAAEPEEVVETVGETVEVEEEVEATAIPASEGPEGTLVRALTTFPNSLDIPQAAERQASSTAWQLYDSLVWLNNEGDIEPALAERWDISDDGREYTFYLREGVTFHNGEPFNADAVVFSWERAKDAGFEYSDQLLEADSVVKVDDYTVKITTPEPNALFFNTLHDIWAMVPPGYFAEVGQEGFDAHPIGTGPYKFVEWVKGDHITFEANLDYWRGAPKIQTVIFRPIPESATRVAAIQTGEVDIVTRLSAEEAQSLMDASNVTVVEYPVTRIYYIAFNNLTTGVGQPTEDPLVRQAMNYAVDVDAIVDAIFNGFAKPATGYVATGELGYGAVEGFNYDPVKAVDLLTEAGYPDGFAMDMACPAGAYSHFEEVCEAIVGYLGEVGIEVSLDLMESGQYWDLEANKELPPLFGDSWSAQAGEAFRRMTGALMGNDAAYSSWYDEKIVDLLNQIKATVDREARTKLYEDLQVYMFENPPFIYLYEPVAFEAVNNRVKEYVPRSSETYYLYETFVVDE